MAEMPILEQHDRREIEAFAATLKIDLAHALWIERQRERYVRWEHDYIKDSAEEHVEPVETG